MQSENVKQMEIRSTGNDRIVYFDWLRVVSIAAVVLLHASAEPLYKYNSDPLSFHIGNFYDSLTRWAVPIFIMVSGALMLQSRKDEPPRLFFVKRSKKVLIPFIAWSMIYLIYSHFYEGKHFSFGSSLKAFLNESIYYHLWFFYVIIGLYLITPIFKVYVKHASRENVRYFLILWFISSFIPIVNQLLEWNIHHVLDTVSGFIGLYLLGYYLYRYEIGRNIRVIIYMLSVVSLIVTFWGTKTVTAANGGKYDGLFYSYLTPNTILIAMAVFLLFKHFGLRENKNVFIVRLSISSFGVYLIHPIFLNMFKHLIDVQSHTFITIPTLALLTMAVSFIISLFIQRIPVLKWIMP
ncbi:acyltransferase [Tuberibacillus calidus]|jgi:surface polysaccharide O-acyltransferase-like enzyme|uniref:acyltransferase n=1 Tax=Tuberibacillus calidus TaxID=340097 RepID=UPI00040EE39E|nr:acyltransferase family protein [Tuberibacillus calidus]